MPRNWQKRINDLKPGQELTLTPWARIKDTIKAIDTVSSHSAATKSAQDIAKRVDSPAKLFEYVHSRVKYQPDNSTRQTVRTLDRSLRDGVGNCVDYTAAISAILKAQVKPHKYRLAGYGNNGFEHIYIIVNGKILDPVTGVFNKEEPYKIKKDIMPTLSVLNGPNNPVQAVKNITDQAQQYAPAKGAKASNIYSAFGGLIRQAVRLTRDLSYSPAQADQIIRHLYTGCDAIDANARMGFGKKGSHRQNCDKYVNRQSDDIYQKAFANATGPGSQGQQPGTGGGYLGPGGNTTGGGTTGGGTPPAQEAGFNLAQALPLLAVAAGAVLLSKK